MSKFSIGDKVKHKLFGEGEIVDINGVFDSAKLTIAFSDDKKVIMSKYVKLLKQMFNKIITWYNNQNENVRVIIGALSLMLFTYIVVNLVDLIFFGEANW